MKCMRCGAEIMDGSNFCNVCGAPVQVVAAPVSAPQGSGDPNGGVFSTISTGSAVIWILLAVIYFYLFKYFQNEAMATRHHGPWPK